MGKEFNYPQSQNDVITTMSHALLSFQDMVNTEMPGIPVVYTEDLSYESAVRQILANNNYGGSTQDVMPFFAYNRTVLREVQERALGLRAKNHQACIRVGDEIIRYGLAYGEFDIQFMYVSNSVELTEKFEVVYNSDEGITGSKEVEVDMDALGKFKYFLRYQELAEKQIEHEDTFYKAIVGSIIMRGFYFTFRGKSGLIKEINQRIISSYKVQPGQVGEVLGDLTIVP